MDIKVFKFGGACIKNEANIKNSATLLHHFSNQKIVLVVSAIDKTTNELEQVVNAYTSKSGDALSILHTIRDKHLALISKLGITSQQLTDDINDILVDAEWLLEVDPHDPYNYIYDQIVSIGELISSKIIHAYLTQQGISAAWLDIRDALVTDDNYRAAKVLWSECDTRIKQNTDAYFASADVIVTQGFIGSTLLNNTTTLGREGSDFTASVIGSAIDAESVHVWKDVPGIMNADPKIDSTAAVMPKIDFTEASEMCYFGASVLHPKTIKPIQNKGIPLYVRPYNDVTSTGTIIGDYKEITYPTIKIVKPKVAMITMAVKDYSFIAENHLAGLFQNLAEVGLKVYIMRNTAVSFVFCTDDDTTLLNDLKTAQNKEFDITISSGLQLITLRHANQTTIEQEINRQEVIFEERSGNTCQFVIKK